MLPTTIPFQSLATLVPWMILLKLISVIVDGPLLNLRLLIALGANIVLALAVGGMDWRLRYLRNKQTADEEVHSADQAVVA